VVGQCAADGLADPPGRVGGELVALGVVELLDCPDQAEIAFLDQVEERHATADVAFRQGHHQPQVRLQQVVPRPPALADDQTQVTAQLEAERLARVRSTA